MDDWFVQVKECGGDGGGVSYFAEKGIVSILSEESKCWLVVTVKPRAPSATEKGLQALSDAVVKPHHAQEAYRSLAS